MKKYIIAFFSVFFWGMHLYATNDNDVRKQHATNYQQASQTIFGKSDASNSVNKPLFRLNQSQIKKITAGRNVNNTSQKPIVEYYRGALRINGGWFVGLGKLSKEDIKHTGYCKFTKPYGSKHWHSMESFDSYGNPRILPEGTLIVKANSEGDEKANKEFANQLKTVCKTIFIGDNEDKDVIEELALNQKNEIIYSFHETRLDKKTMSGYYLDSNGCPIKSQKDTLGTAASVVHITFDANDNMSLVEFFDDEGNRQKNSDGAYMSRYTISKDFSLYKYGSCNIAGKYIIDDYGNCGAAQYLRNGLTTKTKSFDEKEQLIKIQRRAYYHNNVCFIKYKYDKYGRDIEEKFFSPENKPDTNAYGCHQIVTSYNDHGDVTKLVCYGLHGELVNGIDGKSCLKNESFDKKGNSIYYELKDKDGKYANCDNGFCKSILKYDEKNNLVHQEYFLMRNDSLINCLHYDKKNQVAITKRSDFNYVEVDSLDSDGNILVSNYFNIQGDPILKPDETCHTEKYTYKDGKCIRFQYYGINNEPVESKQTNYHLMERIYNPKECTCQTKIFNKDMTIKDNYILHYVDSTFIKITNQQTLNNYDRIARTFSENIFYYKCNVGYNVKNEISSLIGENEFGEPAYLTFNNNQCPYYYRSINKNKYVEFDENGIEILNQDSFKIPTPKIFTFMVIDSLAYQYGINDGDVVLKFGNWWFSFDSDFNLSRTTLFNEFSRLKGQEKDALILRHYPSLNTSKILHVTFPAVATSQFFYIYFTQKEKARLDTIYHTYLSEHHINVVPYKEESHEGFLLKKMGDNEKMEEKYHTTVEQVYDRLTQMFEPNKIMYHYLCYKQPEVVDSVIDEYIQDEEKNKDYPYVITNALCISHGLILKNDSSTFVTFLKNVANSQSCYNTIMTNSLEPVCKIIYYHTAILLADTKLTKTEKNNFRWVLIIIFFEILIPPEPFMRDAPRFFYIYCIYFTLIFILCYGHRSQPHDLRVATYVID